MLQGDELVDEVEPLPGDQGAEVEVPDAAADLLQLLGQAQVRGVGERLGQLVELEDQRAWVGGVDEQDVQCGGDGQRLS